MYLTPAQSSVGSRVNSSVEPRALSSTGRSLLHSPPRSLLRELRESLESPVTPSSPEVRQQMNMSGRSPLQSPIPDSSSDTNPFVEIPRRIGRVFGRPQSEETYWRLPHRFEYKVIGPYALLQQILKSLLESLELALYSGVELVPASRVELGTRREWMLILKIPALSSGAVTSLKQMLLSMNFEEESTLRICSGGWIVIRSEWKLKVAHDLFLPQISGSPQTWIPENGILR